MAPNNHEVSGFVKAQGTSLVNGNNQPLVLRGVGFGSWFLPEGYMWKFPTQGDRPRKMKKLTQDLLGTEGSLDFWESYYDQFITETDIRALKEAGFNSVRIPLLAEYFDESPRAWERVDRCLDWCEAWGLYVILDLHGAYGGQTGTNIDDSPNDLPELFTQVENQQKTIALWRAIAQRYQDRWIVAGYDLLNEPLPQWFAQYNPRVMPLYTDITKAIREVDPRHLIILEGVHWATDWSIFTETIDPNLMLQFHKYWNTPDTASIQKFLEKRDELGVPIFMGEGGENNGDWYTGAFQLFEYHKISWNFWTWKKMDTTNSPYSIRRPEGWDQLVEYLSDGPRPDEKVAKAVFAEFLENITLENCHENPEVGASLFRRPPCRIPAIFYSFFPLDSFFDRGRAETGFSTGVRTIPNFEHGAGQDWAPDDWMFLRLSPGQWTHYLFEPGKEPYSGPLGIEIRGRSQEESSSLAVTLVGNAHPQELSFTKVWSRANLVLSGFESPFSGRVKIESLAGTSDLEYIRISKGS